MAQFGMQPGDRGTLEVRTTEKGLIEGYFLPKGAPASGTAAANLSSGVKLIEVNPAEGNVTLYPTDTRPRSGSFLGPKYSKIRSLVIPADIASDAELADILDTLPPGFTTDYEYGLGLTRHCDVLVDLIEESTDCTVIEFVSSGDPRVIKHKFLISFTRFNALRTELSRIKNRGDRGIRRVKETHVHNDLAGALGLKPRRLSLGLLETS